MGLSSVAPGVAPAVAPAGGLWSPVAHQLDTPAGSKDRSWEVQVSEAPGQGAWPKGWHLRACLLPVRAEGSDT